MGPRHEGRGERPTRACLRSRRKSFNGATARRPWRTSVLEKFTEADGLLRLQWGHGTKAVENVGDNTAGGKDGGLQWGHGTKAVENRMMVPTTNASSGLQWGHGTKAVENMGNLRFQYADGSPGFNGATARRPWRTTPTTSMRSARSRFNGATARRPWRTSWDTQWKTA